ncbi:MAG: response regulator [bacterium]|nr:response regulator [bacterium]
MDKPIVLLVDDDPNVLDALEAELTPVIAGIGRLATFSSPAEALACVRDWAAASGSIALAIVDQKMPGMTGVDLLRGLQSEPAAKAMRSVLLTGYGGLDCALQAKNLAGVDHFLEKPWNARHLADICRRELRRALGERGALTAYVLRPLVDERELRVHFGIRHEVLCTTRPAAGDAPTSGPPLDIDSYDLISDHYGLFRLEDGEESQVGTHRVVRRTAGPLAAIVREIARPDPHLAQQLTAPFAEQLPFRRHFPITDPVSAERAAPDRAEGAALESTRLAIGAAEKRGGCDLPSLARHVVSSQVARYVLNRGQRVYAAVAASSVGFHAPFGFRERARAEVRGIPALLLCADPGDLPASATAACRPLAERLRHGDSTCYCSEYRRCAPEAYAAFQTESAEFVCPLVAQRGLAAPKSL